MAPQVLRMALQQILDVLAAQLKRLLNEQVPACRAAGAKIGGNEGDGDEGREQAGTAKVWRCPARHQVF